MRVGAAVTLFLAACHAARGRGARAMDETETGKWFTATHATVLVAIIGASGTAGGAIFAALQNVKLEQTKHDTAADLARQDFETKLIFRAIEGSDETERVRNLQFFLKAGFLTDKQDRIRSLSISEFPSKASPSFDCQKDKDSAAQLICTDPELAKRDTRMAQL